MTRKILILEETIHFYMCRNSGLVEYVWLKKYVEDTGLYLWYYIRGLTCCFKYW